jgi:hypothetical protein
VSGSFDKLERGAGEEGRRRARREAADRLLAMAGMGCPEATTRTFETLYSEALEELRREQSPPRQPPPVPPYTTRDYSRQYGGRGGRRTGRGVPFGEDGDC